MIEQGINSAIEVVMINEPTNFPLSISLKGKEVEDKVIEPMTSELDRPLLYQLNYKARPEQGG